MAVSHLGVQWIYIHKSIEKICIFLPRLNICEAVFVVHKRVKEKHNEHIARLCVHH